MDACFAILPIATHSETESGGMVEQEEIELTSRNSRIDNQIVDLLDIEL